MGARLPQVRLNCIPLTELIRNFRGTHLVLQSFLTHLVVLTALLGLDLESQHIAVKVYSREMLCLVEIQVFKSIHSRGNHGSALSGVGMERVPIEDKDGHSLKE